jgi:chemotaxis protein CheD
MQLTVGISDMKVSNRTDDVIVTYSLGSCVGLAIYDPVARVGGMVHCMLPVSKIDLDKAKANPCMFTDTGVPHLISALFDLGAEKKHLIAKVAGAANLLDEHGTFRIGERNFTVLRKVLWKNNILIAAEDTGGSAARTLSLNMSDGRVQIKSKGQTYDLE